MCATCTQVQQEMRGCREPKQHPYPMPDEHAVQTCPLEYFRDNPNLRYRAFELHRHWEMGILPEAGGIMDQAADFSDFILAVDAGINLANEALMEIERRRQEAEERRAAQQQGR